jgi:tetratricopeptide (TPR) repeat protein
MVEAEKLALKGDWRGAAEIWQQVIKKGGKALPSRAAFNMALANEMLGNFNVSLEWLMQAKHLNPNLEGLNDYMEIINYRIKANSPKP